MSYKIILIGDSSVGKSALINRFKNDTFYEQSRSTVGVEFTKRILKFKKTNQNIQIHLWDTAGQERYKAITKQHYRGADGALVIFDFSQPSSYESLINWCHEVKENTPPECIMCIVGNKVDLANDKSKALAKKAQTFAKENRMLYFETSSQWERNEPPKEHFYAKGIENIILDMIENVSVHNPKKSLNQSENISFQEMDSVLSHMKSIAEDTPISYRDSYRGENYHRFNETITKPSTPMNMSVHLRNPSMTLEKKFLAAQSGSDKATPLETAKSSFCGCQ